MAGNSFGTLFRFTTFGESHGVAIGAVLDGVPPSIPLCDSDLQVFLDSRKPGQNRFTTQRREADRVQILSGVFEGYTTGTPIGLIIQNTDQKSQDYSAIQDVFRPGHADFTYQAKYGRRDYRGGGRASARETALRVAAGAVAEKILHHEIGNTVRIRAAVTQIGVHALPQDSVFDWDFVYQNPFFAPCPEIVPIWEAYIDSKRKEGSSTGARVHVCASYIPAGLGDPVYDKLDADIARAMMSINAVKGVEIGNGFDCITCDGTQNGDEMRLDESGQSVFLSNHAGGILGGISTGQDILVNVAFKPTSSILTPRRSITAHGQETQISTKGRHDPCVGIRGAPVARAMLACTLADHWLRHKAQCLKVTGVLLP